MFIGHWAPALIAAAHPKAPGLGTLFLAGQLVDWAFFAFVLTDIEHLRLSPGISVMNPMDLYHMPYTHSMAGTLAFAAGFAALIWLITHNRTGALIGGGVVVSHWFADLLVHIPDLTLWGSPPKLGLGLWNYPAIAMPLELGLTALAFYILIRARWPASARALTPLVILAAVMLAVQAINWFGPQPAEPDLAAAVAVFAIYGVISLIAEWAGRRLPRTKESPA
jgi:heme/copper-type cytochrome/quinol oxidase subunit 4